MTRIVALSIYLNGFIDVYMTDDFWHEAEPPTIKNFDDKIDSAVLI